MKKSLKIIKNTDPLNIEKIEKTINDLEISEIEPKPIQTVQPTQSVQPVQSTQPIQPEPIIKPKKVKTPAQEAAFLKARATKEENFRVRQELKRLQDLEAQKAFEDKVIKKAISLKIKRSKKEKLIDTISDVDENEIEQIKQTKPKAQPKPKPIEPVIAKPAEPLFVFIKRK
jgi:hypothetical protein